MTTARGSLVMVDLGTPDAKYYWNGRQLMEIVKVFVYRGSSLTITHNGLDNATIEQMRAYGIRVKEQK